MRTPSVPRIDHSRFCQLREDLVAICGTAKCALILQELIWRWDDRKFEGPLELSYSDLEESVFGMIGECTIRRCTLPTLEALGLISRVSEEGLKNSYLIRVDRINAALKTCGRTWPFPTEGRPIRQGYTPYHPGKNPTAPRENSQGETPHPGKNPTAPRENSQGDSLSLTQKEQERTNTAREAPSAQDIEEEPPEHSLSLGRIDDELRVEHGGTLPSEDLAAIDEILEEDQQEPPSAEPFRPSENIAKAVQRVAKELGHDFRLTSALRQKLKRRQDSLSDHDEAVAWRESVFEGMLEFAGDPSIGNMARAVSSKIGGFYGRQVYARSFAGAGLADTPESQQEWRPETKFGKLLADALREHGLTLMSKVPAWKMAKLEAWSATDERGFWVELDTQGAGFQGRGLTGDGLVELMVGFADSTKKFKPSTDSYIEPSTENDNCAHCSGTGWRTTPKGNAVRCTHEENRQNGSTPKN